MNERPRPAGRCGDRAARVGAATAICLRVTALCVWLVMPACNRSRPEPAAASSPPAARQPQTAPHGDHNPHHGGIVMMKGDLHYEAVFDLAGRSHQLFFSDAVRDDLPASVASAVSFTVKRAGEPDELVPLQIDASGESWIGSGRPIANAATTTARVAFTVGEEPYWVDVPVNGQSVKH
jgi:hypothetical protein